MLDAKEVADLATKIKAEIEARGWEGVLQELNRKCELAEWLKLLEMDNLLAHPSHHKGKILVVGQSDVSKNDLMGIVKNLKLSKYGFDWHLDYNEAKTFSFEKIQYNPAYILVMVGPQPHSVKKKGKYESIISKLEQEQGYPPVIRLGGGELKITKSNFKEALLEQIEAGTIIPCDHAAGE